MTSVLKSKDIGDYFEADFSDLKPDQVIPVSLHVFFPKNQHIIIFKQAGDFLSGDFLTKYASKGLKKIWIHNDDRSLYETYLHPPQVEEPPPAEIPPPPIEEPPPEPPPPAPPEIPGLTTEQIQEALIDLFKDSVPAQESPHLELAPEPPPVQIDPESEAAVHDLRSQQKEDTKNLINLLRSTSTEPARTDSIARASQLILRRALTPTHLEAQNQAHQVTRQIVRDILENINTQSKSLISQIWRVGTEDLSHASNVATYSVLLALSFGKNEPRLLANLALAGLIHDIGLSQIPLSITSKPWVSYDASTQAIYAKHIESGLELTNAFGGDLPSEVKALIESHHEKFDGTGYPNRVKGFQLDSIAQLLAMAELVDSIASGQWDGEFRTYKQTLLTLEEMEKNRTFPEYFNPDILSSVIRWTHHPISDDVTQSAIESVKNQASGLLSGSSPTKRAA